MFALHVLLRYIIFVVLCFRCMNSLHVMFPLDQSTLHVVLSYVIGYVILVLFVLLCYIICRVMFSMHEQFACCVSSGAKHAAHFVSPHLSQLQLIALHCLLKRSFECKLQNVFVEIAKCIC